jgi:hypothetical protein
MNSLEKNIILDSESVVAPDLRGIFNIKPENILISFSGPFDSDIIKSFAEKLKLFTTEDQQAGRKLFFTFIELSQNVAFYSNEKSRISEKKNSGAGSLLIGENRNEYFFVTGNVIFLNSKITLERKIKIINSLDKDELRKYKKEQRNLLPGSNGNAHIGLIMTALTTKRQIQYDFQPIDRNRFYFSIYVNIEKEIQKK